MRRRRAGPASREIGRGRHRLARRGTLWPAASDQLLASFEDIAGAVGAARALVAMTGLRASVGSSRSPTAGPGPGPARGWRLAFAAHPGQVLLPAVDALRIVGALWWLWFSHGHFAEGCDWVARALALDDEPTRDRVRALRAGSHLSWWRGDYRQSAIYNAALLQCAEAIGDDWGRAWAPMAFAAVELFHDPRRALELLELGRDRFRELELQWDAAYALQVVGGAPATPSSRGSRSWRRSRSSSTTRSSPRSCAAPA